MLVGSDPSPAGPGASTQVSSQPRRQPWGLGIDAWSLEKYKGTSAEGMGLRAKAGSRAWKLCQGVQEEASRDGTMSRMGQGGEQGVEAESGGALMARRHQREVRDAGKARGSGARRPQD